jgi:hypothetical protein
MTDPPYRIPDWVRRADALECRACPVVCERVVYPSHCLRTSCRYAYAVDEHETRFFGCVQHVFAAELDISAFNGGGRADPYGPLRARCEPRRECRAGVEQAYGFLYSWNECVNPVFLRDPESFAPEAVRRLVDGADVDTGS